MTDQWPQSIVLNVKYSKEYLSQEEVDADIKELLEGGGVCRPQDWNEEDGEYEEDGHKAEYLSQYEPEFPWPPTTLEHLMKLQEFDLENAICDVGDLFDEEDSNTWSVE